MLPVLKVLSAGTARHLSNVRELVTQDQKLTPEIRSELVLRGRQIKFANRVSWVAVHFIRTELLKSTSRGVYWITEKGIRLFGSNLAKIDLNDLKKYPAFVEWRKGITAQNHVPSPFQPGSHLRRQSGGLKSTFGNTCNDTYCKESVVHRPIFLKTWYSTPRLARSKRREYAVQLL